MRPVTLRCLYEFLKSICESREKERSNRFLELARVSLKLGLIKSEGNRYRLTSDGQRFIMSYEHKDALFMHSLFFRRIKEYRKIFELYMQGVTRTKVLVEKTGYNSVIVDIVLRLISEIENLSKDTVVSERFYSRFTQLLREKYMSLSKRSKSRYVPIVDILSEIKKDIFITNIMFKKFLEKYVNENKGKVVLAGAPLLNSNSKKAFHLFDKKYVYIMIEG